MAQQAWQRDGRPVPPAPGGTDSADIVDASRPAGAPHAEGAPRGASAARVAGALPSPNGSQFTARLTGRGAVLLMVVAFLLGLSAAAVLGWASLAGVAFVLGSAAAARYTKPADLLTVAVTPPLVFCCVLVGIKAASARGNVLFSIAGGAALSLAGMAPWLFAGMAISLVIAWRRGLPRCVSDLRRELGSSVSGTGRASDPAERS